MSKEFREDYGVYVSSDVFENQAPILEAVRDPDGYWQFFSGKEHSLENEEPHLVCVGHLTSLDPSIHQLTVLKPGQFAERDSKDAPWVIGELDVE